MRDQQDDDWLPDIRSLKGFEDQISAAIASHSLWKKHLADAIETGRFDQTPEYVRDSGNCRFGKWLDEVPDRLRDDAFRNVFDTHRAFHVEASEILDLALSGKKEESLGRLAKGSAYAKISVSLIMAIAGWRATNKHTLDP